MCPGRRADGWTGRRAAARGVPHFTRAAPGADDLTPAYGCAARAPVAYGRSDYAFMLSMSMPDTTSAGAARRDDLRRLRALFAALAAGALLAACGGGGSDAAPAPSAVDATPAPGPAPAPAGSATPVVLSTCGYSDFAARLLQRVNTLRASGAVCGKEGSFPPAGALAWNTQLTQAADGHSQDMSAQNYFAHTSLDGRAFSQRISATGYTWSTAGENIAAGYAGIDAVMDGWIASDGHCANLMNANFTEIGVACVPGTSGDKFSNYWTMDLAKPR